MLWQSTKREAVKKFFPLGLSPGELAVYSYLLYYEDRKTFQCWPSYRNIGRAVHMSTNTVREYVAMLEEQGLIITEPTSITTEDVCKRKGSPALYHPPYQRSSGTSQLEATMSVGGNDRADACCAKAVGKARTPRVTACEPLCGRPQWWTRKHTSHTQRQNRAAIVRRWTIRQNDQR